MVETIENIINWFARPSVYVTVATVLSFVMFFNRIFWTKKAGLVGLILVVIFFAFSLRNENFAKIALYPDNVPIVSMLVIVFFFTWLSASRWRAMRHTTRSSRGPIWCM
jgi:uncharacterized membrane protein